MQEGANETSHLGRALALALCTLWGNILFLDGSGSVLLSAPFASRMASMAFSVVGFAAAWFVARSCAVAPMRSRIGLLVACALLSSAGSFLHFSGLAWLPEWIDWVPTAVFSVAFAFLLVACGEVYAEISAGQAVVYASVSYMLAYLGSTVVAEMGAQVVCAVETLLPLVICALVAQPVRTGQASGARAKAAPVPLANLLSVTLEAIPARVLAAIGITYFAIGSTLAQSGAPLDYFSWQTALAAVLTSVVVMATCILLHGRVALTSLYKILMVVQVLAAFLLSEWAEGAQIAVVITFVGVKIVAWTLMAELALLARARGTATAALVYAAGCLAGHIGEGVAGVLSVFGLVNQGVLLIVIVALLVGAAAFLFTGEMGKYPDIADATPASGGEDALQTQKGLSRGEASLSDFVAPASMPAAQPSLDERVAELASAYMLSARETEVFRLWATGHTLKYIQEKLYLSPSTVKTHVRHIYDKTGVHSRSEIVELLDPLADKR